MPDFTTTIKPRFYETDALGHINNAAIAAWFEVARTTLLDSLEHGGASVPANWVLASLQIDFVAEIFYGSDVVATITDARPGNSSLRVACEMKQGGALTVRGSAVLVYMDVAQKKPTRIPDSVRRQLG